MKNDFPQLGFDLGLTLKFLGEVKNDLLERLVVDLRRGLTGLGAVEIKLGGCGFFPSSRRPRVAWVGGTAGGIEAVVEVVERCSLVHGFAREERPWSLHLTQARMKGAWPRWAVERFLEWGQGLVFDPIECTEVILYASDLRPGGAVYTAVERMAFS